SDVTGFASSSITNSGALVFNTQGSMNYLGNISGAGSLTMSGTGSVKLSGSNSYSGATTVNSGTLRSGNANAFGNTTAVSVGNGAGLNLSSGSSVSTLSLNSMTLTGSNNLFFGIGSGTADQIIISNGGSMTITGTTYINLSLLTGGTGVS